MLADADGPGAPAVVLINESMARRFWPQDDPVGRRVRLGGTASPWATIVGVVADVHQLGLTRDPAPELYCPQWQQPSASLNFTVRTAGDPLALAQAIRAEVRAVDRELPIASIRTMRGVLDESVAQPRIMMFLLAIFAGLALALAAMGLYGLISYSVAQRTHELGIRMALGAGRGDILRLVVGEGSTLTLVGVVLGLLASLGLTRVLASFLYGVSARDPLVLGAVALALAPVALAASYFPALRASRVHPQVALRND
jgi:predicted permease